MDRDLADRTRRALLQRELGDALALVARAAVDAKLCDHAGVTEVVAAGQFRTTGSTDALVSEIDAVQFASREGPCIEAAYRDGVLHSADAAADPRWPVWGPAAGRRGIGGVISVHLYASDSGLGALNLYNEGARDYTDDDLQTAALIGAHASIALAHFRDTDHLWKAIDARHRIGQAQGILMERFDLTAEGAFSQMRTLSQQSQVKLHLIADQVVRTRTLPRVSDLRTPPPPRSVGSGGRASTPTIAN